MGFGEQLRRRRKELGYSREDLAQKLGITGSAVGNYETGVSVPRGERAAAAIRCAAGGAQLPVPGRLPPPDAGEKASAARRRSLLRRIPASWASPPGRPSAPWLDALGVLQAGGRAAIGPGLEPRTIPLYASPRPPPAMPPRCSARTMRPLPVTGQVPRGSGAGGADPGRLHGALYPRRSAWCM